MTDTPLIDLIIAKIPNGKVRPCPGVLFSILSLYGPFFVRALCQKVGKAERAPGYCAQFCLFRGLISSRNCAN